MDRLCKADKPVRVTGFHPPRPHPTKDIRMADPISPFLRSKHNYLEQAANYLQARGLTIQDTPIVPYAAKNHGLVTDQGVPFILEGWAFCIKGPEQEIRENEYIIRVCNYPESTLFSSGKEWKDRPKFIQNFKGQVLHYACPEEKIIHSDNIMLHEKISSAALGFKRLGVPALAISGCTGWGKGGELSPELLRLVKLLRGGAGIIVCFDGDIVANPHIMSSAQMLKAAISRIRPDIRISFPMVPDMQWGVGWDDWAVGKGPGVEEEWVAALASEGVTIYEVLRLTDLVVDYGVSTTLVGKSVQLEQTADNYSRLLNHPRWVNLKLDILGSVYRETDAAGSRKQIHMEYVRWMERSVCAGYGGKVRNKLCEDVIAAHLVKNRTSIALEILKNQPAVLEEEARAAAHKLITEGLEVTGPMTYEETIETLMRMFRDIAMLWSEDPALEVDAQWVLALVGPTGCGKTNFFDTILSKLGDFGYDTVTSQLAKEGPRANLTEYNRAIRDSHASVFDEYNPNDMYARTLERDIFTLVSKREFSQRKLYEEDSEVGMRHAFVGITTTDRHKQYIRSAEGTGERRFITLLVRGVREHAGLLSSDREIVAECGLTLLTWAAQRGAELIGGATEFSVKYCHQFIREANVIKTLAEAGVSPLLQEFGTLMFRPGTNDYRFTLGQIRNLVANSARLSSSDRNDLDNLIEQCGAKEVGKARINDQRDGKKEMMKDTVHSVQDWDEFCNNLRSKF